MRKILLVGTLTLFGIAALPSPSDARGRRQCCPCPCQCFTPCYGPCVYLLTPEAGPPSAERQASDWGVPIHTLTIKGHRYQLFDMGPGTRPVEEEDVESTPSILGSTSSIPMSERFRGTVRHIAKTQIPDLPNKTFSTVTALRESLPSDSEMADLGIGRGPGVDRVAQEQHEVTVNAYIYAFTKESDNDYHVIVGDAPGSSEPMYMNTEVSGIPVGGTDQNRNRLLAVRKLFKDTFQVGAYGPTGYLPVRPPVAVRITGPIFWDVEHYPRTVGPTAFKPNSAWEIHPIADIEFLGSADNN